MHYSARQIVASSEKAGIPFSNIEKIMVDDYGNIIGRKMNVMTKNLDEATEAFETATKTILQSSDAMHAQMDSLSKRAKDSIGRAKDMSAQMTDAMNKVTKLVGPDFEKRLDQLEQLTKCLERLSALNDAGKLAPMLAALHPSNGPAK
jgi:hypothetical protein